MKAGGIDTFQACVVFAPTQSPRVCACVSVCTCVGVAEAGEIP